MLKKLCQSLGTLLLVSIVGAAATIQPAEAGRRGVGLGIGAGIVTLGVLGAISEARARERYYYRDPAYYRGGYGDSCYQGPRQCRRVGGGCYYTEFGEYVCRRGRLNCWRPTYCD